MEIKTNGNELIINGESVMIANKLMVITKLLLKTEGVVTRDEIKKATGIQNTHTIAQHITTLRKVLASIDGPTIITHFTVGYEIKETL